MKTYIFEALKTIAFILSVFILFLTVKPEIELVIFNVGSEHCCDHLPLEKSKPDQKEPCTYACNPFHGCSLCKNVFIYAGFCAHQNHIEPVLRYYSADPSFVSLYIPDFWKPPRFV